MTSKSSALKKRLIKHLKNDIYFRIKPSAIQGVGIFAIRDIPKGVNPFKILKKINWIKFKRAELDCLNKQTQKIIDDFYTINDTVWLPENGLNVFDISFYVNHSNHPNLKTTDGGENFLTMRKVKVGEELTANYKKYYP